MYFCLVVAAMTERSEGAQAALTPYAVVPSCTRGVFAM